MNSLQFHRRQGLRARPPIKRGRLLGQPQQAGQGGLHRPGVLQVGQVDTFKGESMFFGYCDQGLWMFCVTKYMLLLLKRNF